MSVLVGLVNGALERGVGPRSVKESADRGVPAPAPVTLQRARRPRNRDSARHATQPASTCPISA